MAEPRYVDRSGRANRSLAAVLLVAVSTATFLVAPGANPGSASSPTTRDVLAAAANRTQIAWSRFTDREFSAARIVSSKSRGDRVRELTHSRNGVSDIDPSISPNGRWIAFERDFPNGSTAIGIVGANGRHERVLDLGCERRCAADVSPTWTPDGHHLVFTRVIGPFDGPNNSAASAVLMITDLAGHNVARLSEPGIDGDYEDYKASFAPRGYVVFVRIRNSDVRAAVFRMSRDGMHVRRLTAWRLDADLPWISPARSGPTKNLVVFETFGHGAPRGLTQAVATVPARCRPIARCKRSLNLLTSQHSDPVANFNPTWSPHGRRIAFVRFRAVDGSTPRGDIWTMRWDGTHKQVFARSPLFEFRPSWGVAPRSASTTQQTP